jgi:hypothetical protein
MEVRIVEGGRDRAPQGRAGGEVIDGRGRRDAFLGLDLGSDADPRRAERPCVSP